ncbi:MAG: OB-fold nucleic acid binding domain-containing protein, partial [Desulfobacterales bacterium]
MKTKFIQDLQAGDTIDDIFVLAEKNLARKRNGENYLTVTLCDRSGRIRGVMWDNLELIKAKANSGDYVRVKGGISEYKGALQFVVRDMEAIPADALDP